MKNIRKNIQKTLYIPLCAKAMVSRRHIILADKKAEEIWNQEKFFLKSKSKSKWLAYYLSMRASVFDNWLTDKMRQNPKAHILHIGCGLDSRILRVGHRNHIWYDIDFPDVISVRKKYFQENHFYHMLSGDIRNPTWLDHLPAAKDAIIILEGISMYLTEKELQIFFKKARRYFGSTAILIDCYTKKGAKISKYKNPVNDVGVRQVFGMDNPHILAENTEMQYIAEHTMTPQELIMQLPRPEQQIFQALFADRFSKNLYRIYEYASN